jgi:hypothetical protein
MVKPKPKSPIYFMTIDPIRAPHYEQLKKRLKRQPGGLLTWVQAILHDFEQLPLSQQNTYKTLAEIDQARYESNK